MSKNFIFSILDYINKNTVDVLLVVAFLFVILIFIVTKNFKIKDKEGMTVNDAEKVVNNNIDIEKYDGDKDNDGNDSTESIQFCKANEGQTHILEEKCNSLQNDNCKMSGCCVLANFRDGQTKCVAGSKLGPTYLSDEKQNFHEIDNYYYQNKCYGKDCQ